MMRLVRHIPNILTATRLAAGPFTAFFLLEDRFVAAFALFVFAGMTDAADGFLAKRFNLGTRIGAYLDPAADKLLMLISFLTLSAIGTIPLWLTALVIARDVAIVLAVLIAKYFALPLNITPQLLGKICTFVQVSYVTLMLLLLAFGIEKPWLNHVAAAVTALATLASWLSYGHLWVCAVFFQRSRPA